MEQPTLVITSGRKYLDIDAYASMIAYRELLRAQKYTCYAISTAPTNESVPKSLLQNHYELDNTECIDSNSKFILVDVSNPEFFDTFVTVDKIVQIVDHHGGFEEFWQKKLGKYAEIETIGAVCVMIYEKITKAGKPEILSQELCKLLIAGILDNTLNLKASMTTERDRIAYAELRKIGKVSADFAGAYFRECFEFTAGHLEQVIDASLKIEKVSNLLPEVFGQLIVPQFTEFDEHILEVVFKNVSEWIFNLISLDDGKSYLYCSNPKVVKSLLTVLSGAELFRDNCVILQKFLLRKGNYAIF